MLNANYGMMNVNYSQVRGHSKRGSYGGNQGYFNTGYRNFGNS